MSRIIRRLLAVATMILCGCAGDAPEREMTRIVVDSDALIALPAPDQIHRVRDMLVDGEDRVWILSIDSPFVSVVDPDGEVIAFGTRGPGPRELGNPWSLIPDAQHEALLWDAGRRRVLGFRVAGDSVHFLSATRVEIQSGSVVRSILEITYGTPLRMAAGGAGMVMQPAHRSILNAGDLRELVLLTGRAPDQLTDTLYRGPADLEPSTAEYLVQVPLWTTCADGRVIVLEPTDRLIGIHPSGSRDTSYLPLRPGRLDESDLRRNLRHVMEVELVGRGRPPEDLIERRITQAVRSSRDLFGPVAPAATGLLCDEAMNVWVQGFSTVIHPVGFGNEWLVFSKGQEPVAVRFPAGFTPRSVRQSGIYGSLLDSLGLERPYHIPMDDRLRQVSEELTAPLPGVNP